jgi:hypothetical protein
MGTLRGAKLASLFHHRVSTPRSFESMNGSIGFSHRQLRERIGSCIRLGGRAPESSRHPPRRRGARPRGQLADADLWPMGDR